MYYKQQGGDFVDYRRLDDFVMDLVMNPDELFIRDRGCEALVYVQEFDSIWLIEDKQFIGSQEACEEHLKRMLQQLKEDHGL